VVVAVLLAILAAIFIVLWRRAAARVRARQAGRVVQAPSTPGA
jgi:hypothetical protein